MLALMLLFTGNAYFMSFGPSTTNILQRQKKKWPDKCANCLIVSLTQTVNDFLNNYNSMIAVRMRPMTKYNYRGYHQNHFIQRIVHSFKYNWNIIIRKKKAIKTLDQDESHGPVKQTH